MTLIYHPAIDGVDAVPDTWVESGALGWTSGSISIPVISANGGYEFKIPSTVVGVIIGIADNYTGIGYKSIQHALYFSRGQVVLYENGIQIESLGSYAAADTFVFWRGNGKVYVLQNGVKISSRPQQITGPFRLASTLYAQGDSIVDAKVTTLAVTSGDVRAVLPAITGMVMQGYTNWIGAELLPISGLSSARGNGRISAGLGAITGSYGKGSFANITATLPAIVQYMEAGSLAPAWGSISAKMMGVSGVARGLTGELGRATATLKPIKARSSNRIYGEVDASLGAFEGFSAQAVKISFGLLVTKGAYTVVGSGFDGLRDDPMVLPAATLSARFGAQGSLTGPSATLAVGMTIPVVGRGSMTLPATRLWANGTAGGTASAFLTTTGGFFVSGQTGAQGQMTLPTAYPISASGMGGGLATGKMALPRRYSLLASGTVRAKVEWALSAPSLQLAPTGHAWLVAPSLQLFAEGGQVVAAEHEAYAINLTTGAVTRYTNYPFDNVLRFGNRFFGIKADGVFELAGDTDLGEPISAKIKTFQTDFGSTNYKHVAWVYLTGRMPDGAIVSVQADEADVYPYTAPETRLSGTQTTRAKVGRGIKGTYYSFTIENVNGGAFEMDHADVIIDNTTRAI